AAAEIEHGLVSAQKLDVGTLPLTDLLDRRTHACLVGEVVPDRILTRLRRDSAWDIRLSAPLETQQPLLQLGGAALGGLRASRRGVDARREHVGETEDSAVEGLLRFRERPGRRALQTPA